MEKIKLANDFVERAVKQASIGNFLISCKICGKEHLMEHSTNCTLLPQCPTCKDSTDWHYSCEAVDTFRKYHNSSPNIKETAIAAGKNLFGRFKKAGAAFVN